MNITPKRVEKMIYIIRGERVMADFDLAELYGVKTKRLNEQVKRNMERFPKEFMFQCNSSELEDLRSQFATANPGIPWNYKRRTLPMLFTEHGVAQLSTVLKSKAAIKVNIAIIKTFVKVRQLLSSDESLVDKIKNLEKGTKEFKKEVGKLFKIIFERLEYTDEEIKQLKRELPSLSPTRKKIGLKPDHKKKKK